MEIDSKICSRCGLLKPVSQYHKCGGGRHRPNCKSCHMIDVMNWRRKNQDTIRLQHRKYYAAHKELCLARAREWHSRHPDYGKKYASDPIHKVMKKESDRRYYQNHREKLLEKTKKWQREHPEFRERYKQYRKEHPLPAMTMKKYARKSYLKHRTEIIERCRRWQHKYPERYHAQSILNRGIITGYVQRPRECSSCGREKLIHGHHPDYTKPFEVIWLCPSCHKLLHQNKVDVAGVQ